MFPMTPQGLSQLQKELRELMIQDRPKVAAEIAHARQYGDLSENAEYHAAKEKQRYIENRIHDIGHKIAHAQVVDLSTLSGPQIVFGAYVTLYDEEKEESVTYQIVGQDEADLTQKKIAITSVLARALIGKEEGMTLDIMTPRGEKVYTIERVSYRAI